MVTNDRGVAADDRGDLADHFESDSHSGRTSNEAKVVLRRWGGGDTSCFGGFDQAAYLVPPLPMTKARIHEEIQYHGPGELVIF